MRFLRASLLVCVAGGLMFGCGGAIAGGDLGKDGGAVEDAPTVSPPPTGLPDASPPPFDAPVTTFDTGACLVDLEPCIASAQCCSGLCNGNHACGPVVGPPPPPPCEPDGYGCQGSGQCCSGICGGGVCGGVPFDSGPTCSPDGYACQSYTECCSSVCSFGVCGTYVDAGPPPPACYPTAPTGCDMCLVGACCPQLAACEADPTCTAGLDCFNGCYAQGSGNAATCVSKCGQAYPSAPGNALDQCGANACASSCN